MGLWNTGEVDSYLSSDVEVAMKASAIPALLAVVARGNASDGHWDDGTIENIYAPDVYDNGAYDLDLSFITSDGPPEQTRWMRMRPVVGHPQTEPRASGRILP
jgi:hypothetical protein